MKIIKIGAVWCSSCLVMRKRWEKIEKENPWLETEYLDYDQDEQKIKKHKVESDRLPVFIFIDKNNQEFLRLHGEIPKQKLKKIITENKQK